MDDAEMALRIKAERKQYEDVDEVTHNRDLHRRILSTWRSSSPKMVRELEALKILDDMAFVCQERMWRTAELYQKGGMYFTDAREQAEREHLMLEPEDQGDKLVPWQAPEQGPASEPQGFRSPQPSPRSAGGCTATPPSGR